MTTVFDKTVMFCVMLKKRIKIYNDSIMYKLVMVGCVWIKLKCFKVLVFSRSRVKDITSAETLINYLCASQYLGLPLK